MDNTDNIKVSKAELVTIFSNWLSCPRKNSVKACSSNCSNRGCWTISEMENAVETVLALLSKKKNS